MNSLNIIRPYRYNDAWVFDDAQNGLLHEPFVAGADTLIDHAVADIPNAAEGFNLIFSAGPFPGHQYRLQHRRREFDGNWYYSPEFDLEGWLCPALFHYFEKTPHEIFIKVEQRQPMRQRDPEELDDPVLYGIKRRGEPITRENYIRHNWTPDIMPNPWTAEHEAELPEELQDHVRFPELKP